MRNCCQKSYVFNFYDYYQVNHSWTSDDVAAISSELTEPQSAIRRRMSTTNGHRTFTSTFWHNALHLSFVFISTQILLNTDAFQFLVHGISTPSLHKHIKTTSYLTQCAHYSNTFYSSKST